ANAASSSEIDLTWTNNASTATNVLVERSTDGTNFSQIASVAGAASSYQDLGLHAGTTYYYRVRAANSTGDSPYSNVANAATSTTQALPAAPSNLSASAISSSQIGLSWTSNSSNVSNFLIERSTDGVNYTQINMVAGKVTTYTDTGL